MKEKIFEVKRVPSLIIQSNPTDGDEYVEKVMELDHPNHTTR